LEIGRSPSTRGLTTLSLGTGAFATL